MCFADDRDQEVEQNHNHIEVVEPPGEPHSEHHYKWLAAVSVWSVSKQLPIGGIWGVDVAHRVTTREEE